MQSGERIVINQQDYWLGALLSTGASSYGQVWAATDAAGSPVAIKLINTEAMALADPSLRGHWRAHLEREIKFLLQPNSERSRYIVTLLNHGKVNGQPVLVMERLSANLGQWLAQQRQNNTPPLELEHILDWAGQILCGLDVIHGAGFVYRDLKFSNILVDDAGALLKLADFGSLKRLDSDNTRSFIGTPATMAPEQVLPVRLGPEGYEYVVDSRADYYALGLLLFILLTEQPATAAQRRLGQLLVQHGQEGAATYGEQLGELDDEEQKLLRRSIEFWTVPAVTQPGNGTAALLTDLIVRLLARDPNQRPQNSAEIRAIFDAVRAGQLIMPAQELEPGLSAPAPNWDISPPTLPPNLPPNWLPRRSATKRRAHWPRRVMALTGILGMAGALAWAIAIRPIAEVQPDHIAAPATATTTIPPESVPATDSSTFADTMPSAPEPNSSLAAESVAEPAAEPMPEPVDKPTPDIVTAQPEPTPSPVAEPVVAKSIAEPIPEPVAEPTLRTHITAKPSHPAKPKSLADTTTTVAPAAPSEPSSPSPPVIPLVAKPEPKSSAPAKPESTRHSASSAISAKTTSPPHRAQASRPARIQRTAKTSSSSPPASSRSATGTSSSTSSSPVTHAQPRLQPTSTTLPPIELTSRSRPAPPTLPPIKLTSRSRPAPPTLPPISLVSRADSVPTRAPAPSSHSAQTAIPAPASTRAPTTPARRSVSRSTKSSRRSLDPIDRLQQNAARATVGIRRNVEAVSDWVGRTSTSVGTEIQRGLDSTQRALTLDNQAARVERRDQRSRRY